jgi:outer membrane protein TolC
MVLLPASWISELPSEVLEAVIAHELAHLRRWDLPINFTQRVVETLLFFHPAVWWCSRRLRIEREMCCDELAQAAIGNRVVYAKALAYLAHQQCSSIEPLLAAGIGGKKMVLLERICNVLGVVRGRHGRLYGPSCALFGAVVASLVWIAVFGLSAQWQSGISNTDLVQAIVANVEPSTAAKAPHSRVPTDAIKQSTPLDNVSQALDLLTLDNRKFTTYWHLGLEEAIKTSKANSKAMRMTSGNQENPACKNCLQTEEGQQRPALAHTNVVLSRADFESCVRNLVCDTKNAYWELSFAYRNLATSNTALESARQTWRKIYKSFEVGTRGGEAKEEAQAREQYFQFKSQTQTLLNELFRAENRLRYVMGLSTSDDRLICPTDQPTLDKVQFDFKEITQEAMSRNPDLRRRKWRIKQRELEIIAAKNLLLPHLDTNGTYRWLGLGDTPLGTKPEAISPNDQPTSTDSNALQTLTSDQFQEWQLGAQTTMTIGFHRELAQLRHYQLQLAKERAKLKDEELEVSHQLADAVRQLTLNYELTETNHNRTLAADKQVEAVQAAFDAETVTLDQLLEAQRRRADSQAAFFRALLDYQRSIILVDYRKGSLL